MPDLLEINRPGEVYAKGYAPKPAWERYGIHSPPLADLLPPAIGDPSTFVFFSVPSNIVDRSTAFVTGDPFVGSSYAILAGVATSGTPAFAEMQGWRKSLGDIRLHSSTPYVFDPHEPPWQTIRVSGAVDAAAALRDVLSWAQLRPAGAANLLGSSRRSIYNWLGGGGIQDDFRRRIVQLREALKPIAESRDPALVADWLGQGNPAPAVLVRSGRWDELASLVEETTRPLRPVRSPIDSRPGAEPEAYSREARQATLAAFSAPLGGEIHRREDWEPRELTGLETTEYEE